jgi:hypothetical protein
VPLLANATISTTRAGVANLLNVPLRIYPDTFERDPVGTLLEQAPFKFIADLGTDLQMGDVVSGYNPLGYTPATTFVVRYVARRDGLLPHLEGVLLPTPNATKLSQYQQIDQTGFMPATCNILRDTPTSDGQGGWTSNYVAVTTGLACRLRSLGDDAQEIEVAGELAGLTRWVLSIPAGTDIRARDRVQVGTATYEVVDPLSLATWGAERRVILAQIQRQ